MSAGKASVTVGVVMAGILSLCMPGVAESEPTMRVAAYPARVDAPPGTSFMGRLEVTNDEDVLRHVVITSDGPLAIQWQNELDLAAHGTRAVDLTITIPIGTPTGNPSEVFEVWDRDTMTLLGSTRMSLDVLPDNATSQEINWVALTSVGFIDGRGIAFEANVSVENPGPVNVSWPIRIMAYPGWEFSVTPGVLHLGANGGSTILRIHGQAESPASRWGLSLLEINGSAPAHTTIVISANTTAVPTQVSESAAVLAESRPSAPALPNTSEESIPQHRLDPRSDGAEAVPIASNPASMTWPELGAIGMGLVGFSALTIVGVRRVSPLSIAALYARLAPSRLFEHPARRAMRERVAVDPGISVNELERASGLAHGAFAHHLRKLEQNGAFLAVRDGQLKRLYVAGGAVPEARSGLDARIVTRLREGPVRAADLAEEFGASRQALHYHLRRLQKEGVIRARRSGRDLVVEARG